MKKYRLTEKECNNFLQEAAVGRLSTINDDGMPYTIPVHFSYADGKIQIHGSTKGQKGANIKKNNRVCFEVDEMEQYVLPENNNACNVNTVYRSVIIEGEGRVLENPEEKRQALSHITAKYTPQYQEQAIPRQKIDITGVIEIKITKLSGISHR